MPHAPIRVAGDSPFAHYHHPQAPPRLRRSDQGGSSIGLSLLLCSAAIGALAAIGFVGYWRELGMAAFMFAVSALCGLGVYKIDRRQW